MLTLPFALRELGWLAGILALTVCAGVSFYAYTIISQVLEHSERRGHRFLRFRDLGAYVLGTYLLPARKKDRRLHMFGGRELTHRWHHVRYHMFRLTY